MIDRAAAQREYELVQCCLTGDQEAWHLLFADQQPRLLAKVRQLHGPMNRNDDLAEEVAARVWSAVLADDCHMLRAYDPRRARLSTFLGRRAFFEMLMIFRAHTRRLYHETHYKRGHHEAVTMPLPLNLVWQELDKRLTDSERSYLNNCLLRCSISSQSADSLRLLHDCVHFKVLAYLDGD